MEIIRSRRKTIGIEITPDGRLLVRAPMRMPERTILRFVEEKRPWIEKHLEKVKADNTQQADVLTEEELRVLREKAGRVIPERVGYYALRIGVTYGRITIRTQKTRWGSCSGKGNLNFNCLLMLAPAEALDSVIVHELCHRKEMNHSARFYAEVLRVFPEYKKWNAWLKKNGPGLMRRVKR